MTARSIAASVPALMLFVGCSSTAAPPPDEPRVAIVYDSSVPEERQIVAPAVLAARLGLREAGFSPIDVDLGVDPDAAVGIARDRDVAGVIVTPFVDVSAGMWAAWTTAGLPVLSLNQLAPPDEGVRQMTPLVEATAAAVSSTVGGQACVLTGAGTWSAVYAAALLERRPDWRPSSDGAGCDGLIWSGPSSGAPAPGAATSVVLTDQARTTEYLRRTGPADGRPSGVCGCVDPATVTDEDLQTFVHRYQAGTGLEPGPYAAEAYDAALLLGSAWEASGNRAGTADMLSAIDRYEGVAATYRWADGGLVAPAPVISEALGWRWVPS